MNRAELELLYKLLDKFQLTYYDFLTEYDSKNISSILDLIDGDYL